MVKNQADVAVRSTRVFETVLILINLGYQSLIKMTAANLYKIAMVTLYFVTLKF